MKKFMSGFLCAALLFVIASVTPVIASEARQSISAVSDYVLHKAAYKIVVKGQPYDDPNLPALNYNGNTYIPLKNVAKILGVTLNWNADKGQAEIGSAEAPVVTAAIVVATPVPTVSYYVSDKFADDNREFANIGGIVYITPKSADLIVSSMNVNLCIFYNASTHCLYLRNWKSNQILSASIPFVIIDGRSWLDYSYFKNTILPLVK